MTQEMSSIFAGVTLIERIALGGTAELFLGCNHAQSSQDNTPIIVKRLLPHLENDPQSLSRFVNEANLLGQLSHRCIPRLIQHGSVENAHYHIIEYVSGADLSEISSTCGLNGKPMSAAMVAYIGSEISSALESLHSLQDKAGLATLHRDVTPNNMLLGLDGSVHLIDFGLARTETPEPDMTVNLEGKLNFEAPETLATQLYETRTDLYSLGMSLFQIWTGLEIVNDTNQANEQCLESLVQYQSIDPTANALARCLIRCLQPAPESRYHTVSALTAELRNIAQSMTPNELRAWFHNALPEIVSREQLRLSQIKNYRERLDSEAPVTIGTSTFDHAKPNSEMGSPKPSLGARLNNRGTQAVGSHNRGNLQSTENREVSLIRDKGAPNPLILGGTSPTLLDESNQESKRDIIAPDWRQLIFRWKPLLPSLVVLLMAAILGSTLSQFLYNRIMHRRPGKIMLDVEPNTELIISLDGQIRNSTRGPTMLTQLTPGEHLLVVQKEGFGAIEKTIDVQPAGLTHLNLNLKRIKKPTGKIQFTLDVESCFLSIDGRVLDLKNGQIIEVPAEVPLDISLSTSNKRTARKVSLELKEDEEVNLSFILDNE